MDREQELALLPMTDPLVSDLLVSVPEEQRADSWWLVQCDGIPIPGRRGGGIALLKQIQVTCWIGRLLAFLRLSPLIDALDRRFAVWRRWLSDYVPDGSGPRRFP